MGRGTHWVQVFTLIRGGCGNHRCHNKTLGYEMSLGMWMMPCPEAMGWGFGGIFERKQLVEIWSWTKRVDFWTWVRPVQLLTTGCPRVCWVRWNGQHGKNFVSLSLSSCRKPKSQEVNKRCVPELKVVSVSGFLYVNVLHIWIFHIFVFFYVTLSRQFVCFLFLSLSMWQGKKSHDSSFLSFFLSLKITTKTS